MMHWWGGDYGMGFGGGIFMILFWVLIILGVVYLVKMLLGGNSEAEKLRETAREDLEKMNFEMGRIWKEIYKKKSPATK